MNRYGLPIVVAIALHSIFLFGFNCRPSKATVPKDILILCGDPLPMPPEEIELILPTADLSPPASAEFNMPPFGIPEPICCLLCPLPGETIVIAPPKLDVDINHPRITSAIRQQEPFASGDIIPSTLLDRVPTPRRQVPPVYPFSGKTSGLVGQVMVEFVVDERGDVVWAKIVKSTAREFEEPTLQAMMKWTFEPGRRDGRVVPFRMAIPIVFDLRD